MVEYNYLYVTVFCCGNWKETKQSSMSDVFLNSSQCLFLRQSPLQSLKFYQCIQPGWQMRSTDVLYLCLYPTCTHLCWSHNAMLTFNKDSAVLNSCLYARWQIVEWWSFIPNLQEDNMQQMMLHHVNNCVHTFISNYLNRANLKNPLTCELVNIEYFCNEILVSITVRCHID